jgi:hypothetical protein
MSAEPEYAERFARQKIKVMGTSVEVHILGEGAELPISVDLSSDMDRVAAQLAYWGAVAADAEAELTKVDAWYRRYRAETTRDVLAKDPKLPEWKVKNAVEVSDGFIKHKDAIAMAEKNLALCEAMVRAFDKKANQLQSRGAKVRSELGAQGMTTPETPREGRRGWNLSGKGSDRDDDEVVSPSRDVRRSSSDERERRMQEINNGKRRNNKDKR